MINLNYKGVIKIIPFTLNINLNSIGLKSAISYNLQIDNSVLTLIGPNGSGKTQLLRCIKNCIKSHVSNKKVRMLSAGRIGLFEQYRSDYDGHRGSNLEYDNAQFGSKNDSTRRHNYETIIGDFQTLSVRPDILVKVQERLKKLFSRALTINWDGGYLKILFSRIDQSNSTYSSGREASGLLHLIAILSALYDDEVGVLLLDEPEVSLHPQLQSFLMREINKYAGDPDLGKKIVVIATHSTEFIEIKKVDDIPNLVFCYDLYSQPIQVNKNAGELQNKKISELLSRFGQSHKLAFFCKRPLLVEGPSDSIICSGIERKLDLYIEASGVQILPVLGKGEMPVVIKFMKLIGKDPIILTDADSFTDGLELTYVFTNTDEANNLANSFGFPDANTYAKTIFDDFCKVVDANYSKYEDLFVTHNYWINKKSDDEPSKVRRRVMFTLLFSDNSEIVQRLSSDKVFSAIKTRLISLLTLLEKMGCFILKKGTIESYYNLSDKATSTGKPMAAVEEMTYIETLNNDEINTNYEEIANCLRFASRTKKINEVESLRELLLAVLAPTLAILNDTTSQEEINSIMRNIIGERAVLFKIELVPDKKGTLIVNLDSTILETDCFPFEVDRNENLVAVIDKKLKL